MRRQLKDYCEIKFGTGAYYIRIFESRDIYLLIISNKNALKLRTIKIFDIH